jgi:hypothetical protein
LTKVRMITAFVVVSAFFVMGGSSMPNTMPRAETCAAIMAAVLTDAKLSGYYHRSTFPQRFPLQIVDAGGYGLALPDPARTDVPAVLVSADAEPDPQRAALIIEQFDVRGNAASVSFRFPAEGLSGTAILSVDDRDEWHVSEMSLTEY